MTHVMQGRVLGSSYIIYLAVKDPIEQAELLTAD